MRWFWSLVLACLVAASGARPVEPLICDASHENDRLSPASALPALAGRRETHRAPDFGAPVATVPVVASLDAPRISALVILRAAHARPLSAPLSSRSSRGPPLG